jgi:hypothetical protein
MNHMIPASVLLFAIAACSPEQASAPVATVNRTEATSPTTASPRPAAPSPDTGQPAAATPSARTLTLEGLGALRIGAAVPRGSGWAERGAQVPGGCTTVSSPEFPGAYAIVEGGKVRRITAGERSDVKLVEGIGTGATEAAVRAAFPGFREEPHKYVEAPAKYLTAPNAASGDPALRFEIGADRKVSLIHVGTMPVLSYVEGCA